MTFEEYMHDPANAVYAFEEEELRQLKKKLKQEHLESLIELAKEAMAIPYQSVTYKKELVLVLDKHDYESFSLYGWPNPETVDGLPYIKKDGFKNPKHLEGDKLALRRLGYATYYLALLYYLTQDGSYYKRLRKHLFTFFIDEETKMNPNLNHGQAMPGMNDGQRGGIIDFAVTFGYSLSILQCLRAQKKLDQGLCLGLSSWLRQFQLWLLESPFGKQMCESSNNHSLVYDYLLLIISEFLDDYYMIVTIKSRYLERMQQQILPNGDMPLEMKRVNSRSYYSMNLKLFIEIGKILRVDLKRYPLLVGAVKYYSQHASITSWQYSQEIPFVEEYDNYFYYLAKKYFGFKGFVLKKTSNLQYILLVDAYGGVNET